MGGLSTAARAQVREIIREEIHAELEHIVNPTFVELVTKGARDMERLFDTVIEADKRYADVEERLGFVEALLHQLDAKPLPK